MSTVKSRTPWDGESIRAGRKARGMTQYELADGLGCRQQTISEWEKGIYTPMNAYQKLLTLYFDSKPTTAQA